MGGDAREAIVAEATKRGMTRFLPPKVPFGRSSGRHWSRRARAPPPSPIFTEIGWATNESTGRSSVRCADAGPSRFTVGSGSRGVNDAAVATRVREVKWLRQWHFRRHLASGHGPGAGLHDARNTAGRPASIPPVLPSAASMALPRSPVPSSTPLTSAPRPPGWPEKTSHAMIVRVADATHVYNGMDIGFLSDAAKPSVVVTAADLERAGTRVPPFYEGDLFCPIGKTPLYLGQPAALLILRLSTRSTGRSWSCAARLSSSLARKPALSRNRPTAPSDSPASPARRPTRRMSMRRSRKAGSAPANSRTAIGRSGGRCRSRRAPNTPRPRPTAKRSVRCWRGTIPRLLVLDREIETQSVDRCPRTRSRPRLYDFRPQKPRNRCWASSRPMKSNGNRIPARRGQRRVQAGQHQRAVRYIGGGFACKDHTPFPLYVALAAMFFPGRRCGSRTTATSSSRAA